MAFVVSQGRIASMQRPQWPTAPAIRLATNVIHDYATIYRTQSNVRTVVDFLARNIAQLPFKVYRRQSDADRVRLADHPLAVLLNRPNPFTTRYRLIDSLVHDMGIYDTGIWAKVREDGQTFGLLRLDPRMVTPVGGNFFYPDAYLLRGNGGQLELTPDQVVHFRGYNPHDPRWGCSPVETLRSILAEEYESAKYREQLWRNNARMSGYISRPADAPQWSKRDKDRFRDQWQAAYTGDGPRAGGTPILEDGMTYTAAAVTPEQAQYLETRKLTREECASAYHVPPPLVGILDHATFSNIDAQHEQLYQDTLGPWLTQFAEEIQLQLLPDFADSADVYGEFDIGAKLAGSFEEQAKVLQAATGAPYMTRNEARARLNLPALDDGDHLVTPLNVLVGGQASPQDSAPPLAPNPQQPPKGALAAHKDVRRVDVKVRPAQADVDRIKATVARFFTRQHAALSSQLGAKAVPGADDVWDTDRWDAELAADLFGFAVAVVEAVALSVVGKLGLPTAYDADRTAAWLHAWAGTAAKGINATTKADVAHVLATSDTVLADLKELFDGYADTRATEIAASQATNLGGFGSYEAVHQSGLDGTKTWRVTSRNPRPSHAAMDGQSVGVHEKFSNGASWPGDHNLPVSERARCSCEVVMSVTSPDQGEAA
jgi:HK97 family phage portal protein